MCEEGKIFYGIPERACSEEDDEKREEDDATTAFVPDCLVEEGEHRESSEEEDRHLGSDGAECVRKALASEVFRCEHDEEDDEEKSIPYEQRIPFASPDPFA